MRNESKTQSGPQATKRQGGRNGYGAGGGGADTLTGLDSDADLICGEDDNDTLNGLGGNGWLDGGAGDDVLDGGYGANTLIGGAGNDTLRAMTGDTTGNLFEGGTGDDTLNANAGDDRLDGGAGEDILQGGAGNILFKAENSMIHAANDASYGNLFERKGEQHEQGTFAVEGIQNNRLSVDLGGEHGCGCRLIRIWWHKLERGSAAA